MLCGIRNIDGIGSEACLVQSHATSKYNNSSYRYTGCPKKSTNLKSNCLVAGQNKLMKLMLFVRQDFNLNFDTSFVNMGQKLTELLVQEERITEQTETKAMPC